jgi:hypothetical protein
MLFGVLPNIRSLCLLAWQVRLKQISKHYSLISPRRDCHRFFAYRLDLEDRPSSLGGWILRRLIFLHKVCLPIPNSCAAA